MLKPTNSADYPATQTPIDCTEVVAILQANPTEQIAALDKAMSQILPNVLNSGCQLTLADVNQYSTLKSLRDGMIKSVFNFNIG